MGEFLPSPSCFFLFTRRRRSWVCLFSFCEKNKNTHTHTHKKKRIETAKVGEYLRENNPPSSPIPCLWLSLQWNRTIYRLRGAYQWMDATITEMRIFCTNKPSVFVSWGVWCSVRRHAGSQLSHLDEHGRFRFFFFFGITQHAHTHTHHITSRSKKYMKRGWFKNQRGRREGSAAPKQLRVTTLFFDIMQLKSEKKRNSPLSSPPPPPQSTYVQGLEGKKMFNLVFSFL